MDIDYDALEQLAKIANDHGIKAIQVGDLRIEMKDDYHPAQPTVVTVSRPSEPAELKPNFNRPSFVKPV